MKLVKEILYEKFESDTDPIADLGIGGVAFGVLRYEMKEEFTKMFNDKILDLLLGKTITGTMNQIIIMKKNTKTNSLETTTGNGRGKYTIKVDFVPKTLDIDDAGILVYAKSGENEITAYIIPFDESKIYIHK